MGEVPAIVLVTSSFPIRGDGSEAAGSFVADFAEEMAKHYPVRVVAPGKADLRETWADGLDVFRFKAPEQALSTLRIWHPVEAGTVLRVMRDGASATERAVRAGRTSHLIALWALPCGEWARRSAQRHGLSYSVWTLGSDIWSLGRIPGVRRRLRIILKDAENCWSDGIKLAQQTGEIAGREVGFLPSSRRLTRSRAADLRDSPPYRVLFLGRWHRNKGVDLLLEALGKLTREDWGLVEKITIAGGGPLESGLHSAVQELQVAGRPVALRGFLERDEAQSEILNSDYLLIPSRVESIPVVFSDAMKLRCPVVAMPVGDLPILMKFGASCGVLSSAISPEAFADALRSALRDSPARFESDLEGMAAQFSLADSVQTLLQKLDARIK